MKERIALLIIITSLTAFLIVFQNYFNTLWAIVFLIAIMVLYSLYSYAVTKYKKRKLRKNPPIVNYDFHPFVSILIPCHNEHEVIEKTAQNILNLDYKDFEIILIDDRSTDDTAEIIKNLEKKYDKITAIIRDKNATPGKSAVLNEAMEIAKGEAILVFDADAKVEKDFLTKMIVELEPADVGAVQAQKVIINAKQNFLTQCQYNEYILDTHFQVGRDAIRGAVELRGNGELIKRQALKSINGWNEDTITDDLDMSTRLHVKGWDIRFCPDIKVYEEGVTTFSALIRQRRRWVEGSIRRYLEYALDVFTSKDMSLRVGFDLIAYISEFLLPFWIITEIIIQAFHFVKGMENCILSSIFLLVATGIFFALGFIYSLKKYSHFTFWRSVYEAIVTSIYFITIWFPIAMFIIIKIIFTKKTMDWGKTQHGVANVALEGININD
ncbi:MAG: glycosyltransferase family 2 protein [Candidatus Gastranaerophilales bacterium]|nr:glycosyltransferase family 2 protein [Candidatus Gastranaerophilales bacterium]